MKHVLLSFFLIFAAIAQSQEITIAQARLQPIGTVVTVRGIVTNGSELGVIRYLQDQTAGIAAYSSQLSGVRRGDSILISGTLKNYNSLLELDPVSSFTVLSSNNILPQPSILTPSQVGESYEAQLVTIQNCLIQGATGNFTGNTNYTIISGGQTTVFRIGNGNPLVGTPIPTAPFDLTAIVSQYSPSNPTTGYQLMPRDANDFVPSQSIAIARQIRADVIATNFVQLSWQTNIAGTTEYFYGFTPALELGHVNTGVQGNMHQITINCPPATLLYVNAFSVQGTDTAWTGEKVFISKSLSSGDIKVYFNKPVDTTVSTGTNAISLINQFADTIIAYINRAQQTIDIMMYDNESRPIIEALNAAHQRGVQIRFITDIPGPTEPADTVLEHLNPAISLLAGNSDAIMHNKIMVFDRDDASNCYVITGSTNHTIANLTIDYNNMVIIQDQSLARAIMLEFYEMWGSTTLTPNPALAKFGSQKTDNTPHEFNIGGKRVELYFSPSDQTALKIREALQTADHTLQFGVMAFTDDALGITIRDKHLAGVNVRGIIDYVNYTGSEFQMLLNNNVKVLDYQNPDGSEWPLGAVFHSKYAIVDNGYPDSNPLVVTGSHNWTASADTRNDENTLIIYDATIANLFFQEFTASYNHLLTPLAVNDTVSTPMNTEKIIDFTSNDWIHYQAGTPNLTIFSPPVNGSYTLGGYLIFYTPANDFVGIDSIGYRFCNATYPQLCGEAWIRIHVFSPVGMGEMAQKFSPEIYPNPAINQATLSLPREGMEQISMIDINGKVIHSFTVDSEKGECLLNLSHLAEGIYFVRIDSVNRSYYTKLVKQ